MENSLLNAKEGGNHKVKSPLWWFIMKVNVICKFLYKDTKIANKSFYYFLIRKRESLAMATNIMAMSQEQELVNRMSRYNIM